MEKKYAPYMRYGKEVKNPATGETFVLIEDMSEEKTTVRVIPKRNKQRYDLLKAWERNWKDDNPKGFRERLGYDISEIEAERKGYETELAIEDITPANKVRFIDQNYKTLFEVNDFGQVEVIFRDGSKKGCTVVYIDATHITFVDGLSTRLFGGVFHICQFAEMLHRYGNKVVPVVKEG